MGYSYFFGQQSEMFSFYRIPKILFTDVRFSHISPEAKILYGIMLDRMSLSAKNEWMDELRRVYIIFTVAEIMEALGCGNQKAIKILNELEKEQLVEKKRRGLGKPSIIYVKSIFSDDSAEM